MLIYAAAQQQYDTWGSADRFRDSLRFGDHIGGLAFLLVVGVLAIAFRSWRLVLAAAITLVVGGGWAAAFACTTVGELNPMSIFFGVLWFYPKVALLYAVAYMIMMTILRFMDSLQHDYGYHLTLFSKEPAPHKGEYEWEQEHTFSNPHSFSCEWANWFTLNFGFHNAHHAKPITPWWRLPAVHHELFGDDPSRVIPLWPQLKIFHKHRVVRVVKGSADRDFDPDAWGPTGRAAAREGRVLGGNAASFLTSF